MNKGITRETLQQLWKKAKFYTDEKLADIPDRTGYWNGTKLTLDNLENGIYNVKFISESGIVEGEKQIAVGTKRVFELTLPAATAYMEIFSHNGEKVGRIRTDVPVATGGNGTAGSDGADGKSAYEIWLENGGSGTEADFLASLKGEKGDTGEKGADGYTPVRGVDYATEEDILLIAQLVLGELPAAEGVSF